MPQTSAVAGSRPRVLAGAVTMCLVADGNDFVSRPVAALAVDFAGIAGDHHRGLTRKSGSREPWHPRGSEIRNDRQISIVAADELATVAAAMEIPEIRPQWIGANLVVGGVADLTALPPGTRFLFADGATLLVEAENGPCRIAGAAIGRHYPERQGLDLLFPKHGRHRRGLVASVERPGSIRQGEILSVRIPAQTLYREGAAE